MLARYAAIGILIGAGLAGCSLLEEGSETETSAAPAANAKLETRVLAVVCDNDRSDTQEKLVELARFARERDGQSDRIWEVADNPDCKRFS